MLAGTCNAFSDGWGSSAPRRLSHLAVLRWVLVGQSKVLPCSLGAAGAFQPLQPLHSEEHTWASPRIAILEPCPSNKPPLAEHLWGKISPPGFAQMGKPRHGQVAEVAFGPDGEAAAQGSCTPAQTSTNESSNTFPDLCGPPRQSPWKRFGVSAWPQKDRPTPHPTRCLHQPQHLPHPRHVPQGCQECASARRSVRRPAAHSAAKLPRDD